MFEQFPMPLVLVDSQGKVVQASQKMGMVWDWLPMTAPGQDFFALIPQECQHHLRPAYQAAILTGRTGYSQFFDATTNRWWQVQFLPDQSSQVLLIFGEITLKQEELIWLQAQLTELRRWYQRFQVIAQISQQIFWEWSVTEDRTVWLGDTLSLLGYPLEEMPQSGQAWLALIHPEDVAAVEAGWQNAQRTLTPYCCEYRVRCCDQHYTWVRDCSQYVQAETGDWRLLGVVADINATKEAEAAIANTELRFKNLVANLPGHVFRCANDPDWTIEYLSDNIEQTVGYPASDFVNNRKRTFASIIHPDDQQYVYDTIQDIFQRQNYYGVEYRVIRADGQIRWFYESGQAIYDDSGVARYIDGISIDITVQKLAELELANSEARFRQLVEDVDVGVIVHDPSGKIILANQRAADILGLPLDQILGRTTRNPEWYVTDELGQRLTPEQFPSSQATRQLTTIRDVVLGVNRPGQEKAWVQVTAEPHFDLKQQLEKVIVTLSDITQRKAIEEALRYQSQREQTLNRVIKAIRKSLNLTDIFQTTLNELGHLLTVERVVIVQYRPDLGEWHHLNEYRSSDAVAPMQGLIIPDAENLIADQLKRGETVKIEQAENANHLDPFNRQLFQAFPGNWLIVPLQSEHHPWGALTVHRLFSTQAWHPNEISLLQVIADQLAVAIRQAELYQSLQAANQELSRLAITDDLTQIANRRYFDECLAREWHRLLRDQAPLSLVFCDVDDFKAYNDLYGHQAGDQCLYLVAQALASTARRSLDLVARYGGEEFALILPYTDTAGARQVVENIRTRLQGLGITHADSRVSQIVTVSFGISTVIPTAELSPITLLEAADQALYQAKQNGRNTYCVASVSPRTHYDFSDF